MSKFEDGSYGSLTGVILIGKVLAGHCGMKYTRAAAGNGAIPEDMTPKTMTNAAGYVMDAQIAAVTNPIDGECQVSVQIKSDNVETGFYLTNIVLFAEDPDKGEVPYTYLSLENEPEWIRPASSIVGKLATFDLIAAVGDIDAVSAVIDPDAFARAKDLAELRAFKVSASEEMLYSLINFGYLVEAPQYNVAPLTTAALSGEAVNLNPSSMADYKPLQDGNTLVFFGGFATYDKGETVQLLIV